MIFNCFRPSLLHLYAVVQADFVSAYSRVQDCGPPQHSMSSLMCRLQVTRSQSGSRDIPGDAVQCCWMSTPCVCLPCHPHDIKLLCYIFQVFQALQCEDPIQCSRPDWVAPPCICDVCLDMLPIVLLYEALNKACQSSL